MSQAQRSPIDRLAVAAALVTVVLWASAFVGIRAAAQDLSPGSIALGRLVVGSLALGVLVVMRPWRWPAPRDLMLIAASGLVWFATYNVALNEAERIIDAGTAAMLVNTGPIFIALLAGAFLGEGFPGRLLVGCGVSFAGAAIIGLATSSASLTRGSVAWGIALCVVAALAYAAGVTLQKPALRRVSPIHVTWLGCVVGAILCLPFAPGLVAELGRASLANVGWLVYLGLFPTAIAFTTWAFALGRTTAGRLGSTTYLVPPVVIALSWFALGEVPLPLAVAGGALCIAGVAFVGCLNEEAEFAQVVSGEVIDIVGHDDRRLGDEGGGDHMAVLRVDASRHDRDRAWRGDDGVRKRRIHGVDPTLSLLGVTRAHFFTRLRATSSRISALHTGRRMSASARRSRMATVG